MSHTTCPYSDSKKGSVIVVVSCGSAFDKTADELLAANQKLLKDKDKTYTKVDGIGKGAIESSSRIDVLDKELPCLIGVSGNLSREQARSLGGELEAALVPKP